jgi:hypothetical protein
LICNRQASLGKAKILFLFSLLRMAMKASRLAASAVLTEKRQDLPAKDLTLRAFGSDL